MSQTPDFQWTVDLFGDRSLNEKGWDTLTDSIDAADLESTIHDAVVDAMVKALPMPKGDRDHPMDWYSVRVNALPIGAAMKTPPAQVWPTFPEMTQTRKDLLDGLAALAKWCETCPEDMLPTVAAYVNPKEETAKEAEKIARALASVRKTMLPDFFVLKRDFGPISCKSIFYRSAVCTSRVVGTRTIPATEAREVDVLEWTCAPLLSESTSTEAQALP